MPRIAIAGFQHETNTFGAAKATLRDFEIADSWPRMLEGAEVIPDTAGINLPIAGFADAALGDPSIELVPLLWCAAEPSAHVTDDAFDSITKKITEGLRAAGPLDGVYLDLHGAMVTESHADGEGEILRRVRAVVGDDLPVAVSLDLHANITAEMVDLASFIAIFRTYPHLDMAATGARCLAPLLAQIAGARPAKAFRQGDYLIPLSAQYTGAEPCRALYGALEEIAAPQSADIALGFTAADIAATGPSLVAYAPTQAEADAQADRLAAALADAEPRFDCRLLTPTEAVRAAMATQADRPTVIADVQDNPGAGASSDTTGMLTALVEEGAQGALLGLLHDAEMAAKAHAAGEGNEIEGALGGRSGVAADHPFQGRFHVESLRDTPAVFTGEMYGGSLAVLGPSAVLRVVHEHADVRVVVTSTRSQCLDLGLFTHFGLDPRAVRIIVVKSTVHFRADFEPIAAAILTAIVPGLFPCNLERIAYRHLRTGIRLGPMAAPFSETSHLR